MKSEKEKMLSGELYDSTEYHLVSERRQARMLLKRYNETNDEQVLLRREILSELIGGYDKDLVIEPPFYCDYGSNIKVGQKVYFNFNCVILDVNEVELGDNVMCGPATQIYAATHPMDYKTRSEWLEYGKPVRIGSDVWIGGGAIICPGVKIGSRTVIGAGSVVTRDIPSDVFAAGNPCRVIRQFKSGSK